MASYGLQLVPGSLIGQQPLRVRPCSSAAAWRLTSFGTSLTLRCSPNPKFSNASANVPMDNSIRTTTHEAAKSKKRFRGKGHLDDTHYRSGCLRGGP